MNIRYNRRNPVKRLLYYARRRAAKRGVPFALTEKDITIPTHCPVFGIPLAFGSGYSYPCSPSIDRLVPEKGYVPGNVIVVSHRANTLHNDASLAELRRLVSFYEIALGAKKDKP